MRVAPVVCLTLLIAALGASSAQAGFNCSASAGRITVLGQKVEPVTANAGAADCIGVSKTLSGPAAGLPAPFTAGAVVSSTQVLSATKTVLAQGGASDVKVSALPTLPIQLPKITVPDSLKAVTVDLAPLKASLLPLDPLNLLGNTTIINAVPDTFTIDAKAAVEALAPALALPTLDLLDVQDAMAYAAGTCQGGSPVVSGSSSVAGLEVFGQALPVDELVDRSLTLIGSGLVDPSNANLAGATLPVPVVNLLNSSIPGAQIGVVQAIQAALDKLPSIAIPATVAQVKVTPGLRAQDATSVTQQALTVTITIAGQQLVDAVIGEAKASAAGVDCSVPVTDPGTPEGATLQCSTRRLVLVDVLEHGNRVKLNGVADPALAGKSVAIVFNATGRTVAHAKVRPDGSFDTTAPLPPPRLRDTNDARYMAKLGSDESINLKLRRRMIITSMTSHAGKVTIAGRVVPPLDRPQRSITLSRRVSCDEEKVVTRFMPRKNGRFRVTVNAPKGLGTAVYRMTTKVRVNANGSGVFDTYTLPRAVDLQR
ncbi:MAG: hypothetical protein JWM73_1376 [Solirubrobacterales bacterium]|nr:hypothetical protein [Solirubrobacterales bacterium]